MNVFGLSLHPFRTHQDRIHAEEILRALRDLGSLRQALTDEFSVSL